ncbi:MAG: putative rane protein [Nitrospira sp.]|jgi:hypothetical protein|nr:putative rane protein [Nitrospira sp.]
MANVHTHYDNLKVTRNAPPEVIRAAYRSLSQKYHPDMNPGKPDAERVMKLLNQAYEILSDPIKRQEHDRWIALEESTQPRQPEPTPAPERRRGQGFTVDETQIKRRSQDASFTFQLGQLVGHVLRNFVWYLIGAGLLYAAVSENNRKTIPSAPYVTAPSPTPASAKPFIEFDATTATPSAPPASLSQGDIRRTRSDRVIDQTGTLDAVQLRRLNDKLADLERSKGTTISFLIVSTTLPDDIESYAKRVGDSWKIEGKRANEGVLVLVAKNDRKVRIEVATTEMEKLIPDHLAKKIIDEALIPHFRKGEFYDGMQAASDWIIGRISEDRLARPPAGGR